ncbi:MAG: hypothetical protein JXB38_16720 [Anaerolineales bacterium]|nr:hypothetical protein [Anaerolineales bacterium]
MIDLTKTLLDGMLLSILASIVLIGSGLYNPRLFLQDYPEEIQAKVPPKTAREKRLSLVIGIPFMILLLIVPFISTLTLKNQQTEYVGLLALFLNAFGVIFIFNLFDLLVLDWLVFCTLTPRFFVIPGTEGMAAYKDYGYHFRASLIGTLLSVIGGLLIAGIVFWL